MLNEFEFKFCALCALMARQYSERYVTVSRQPVVTIDLNNVVVALHFRMVRSTARRVIHFQFDISANNLEIRAVQSPNV
jgi:hypothetical protein